ncbi:hypothetical protein VEHSUH05_00665 [Veillonella denticariosi JCM 15641]|uniref:Uncharacterized protein n=1 Tax=Veillonella denticariosi JCM 15641 TaxID=1298594 RepID=A0A2S7ZCI5_9FIRM|nr:DUF5677 domain-containing protein [Veillonella denticariosi]PQL20974.1 hypothetical protein VEHSUH05_00665 [Veillonella denticariosi JCM 15641]
MERIKLSKHIKKGDTLYTPYTNPEGLGAKLSLSSWSKNWLPEYLWIGLIIHKYGRKIGLEKINNIIYELNSHSICIPQFSKIHELEQEQREYFWSIILNHVDRNVLAPFTIVATPDVDDVFYNFFFDYSINIDDSISELFSIIEKCSTFHDELTTDICFSVNWFYIKNGRLKISSKLDLLPQALTTYYKYNHSDEKMRIYRPAIRATFQGVSSIDSSKIFSKMIWEKLAEILECNPLVIVWNGNEEMKLFEKISKVIDYIAATNDNKKMDEKYAVVMGITCYIYKIYKEISEKKLQNDISGRILFRTMTESYINLKYIMLQEEEIPDVYDRFKAYGIGKYKLVMAKLRESKYSVSDDAQLHLKMMELLVNEDMDEAFVDTSFGYFDKTQINKKFISCDEQMLYEIYYEYGTNFTHGFWGAIRESSMLLCDNPTHNYHMIPDYNAEQKLRSVQDDCDMLLKKLFELISGYIELPDFYYAN